MRKQIALIAVILMAGAVSATGLSVEVIDRQSSIEDPAEFLINVENSFSEDKKFRISSITSPEGRFAYNRSIEVEPGETGSFHLKITTGEYAIKGNYRFNVNVRTLENEYVGSVDEYFRVSADTDLRIGSVTVENDRVGPGERVETAVEVVNIAPRDIDYRVEASLKEQETSEEGQLSSGSQRTHGLELAVPEDELPGEEALEIRVLQDGEQVESFTRTVSIEEIEGYRLETESTDRVLEYTEKVTILNTGNTVLDTQINRSISRYLDPLVVFSHPYDSVEEKGGKNIYYWDTSLEPGQQDAVEYTVRYWPPFIVLGLIFAGLVGIKKLQTPVKFSKSVKKDENGLKVHLEIENRSNRDLQDLTVTDFVPNVASVKDSFPMARPVLRKTSNGTRLNWEIEKMEPGEQRVFEYRLEPEVEVEGGVVLSEAELEQRDEKMAETGKVETEFKPE